MATKKAATPADEKFQKQDFDLFEALAALDKKDYGYYDRLTEEQQRKFVPFMMIHWMSAIKGSEGLARYYVMSTSEYANKYLFNEYVQKHPKLQWLMLCAASPGLGKQFHQWIPHISAGVSKLKAPAKAKEIREYYTKIYPKADSESIQAITEAFVVEQKRKMQLSEMFPNLKLSDIETLNQIVSDEDIAQYEEDRGN
jgi:hypothetical protein